METYGEDPYLTGRMAVQFIKGLQGDNPKYLKVVATAKHFAVHSGPEPLRHSFDARVMTPICVKRICRSSSGRPGGRRIFGDVRYNPREWRTGVRQPRLLGEILRANGASPVTWSRIAAPWRHLPGPQGGRHLEEAARRALKRAPIWIAARSTRRWFGGPPEAHHRGGNRYVPTPAVTARSGWACSTSERVPYAQIPYSVNDSQEHRALALEPRANPSCC